MGLILAAEFLFAASVAMAGAAVLAFVDELALIAASDDRIDEFADGGAVVGGADAVSIHNGDVN